MACIAPLVWLKLYLWAEQIGWLGAFSILAVLVGMLLLILLGGYFIIKSTED